MNDKTKNEAASAAQLTDRARARLQFQVDGYMRSTNPLDREAGAALTALLAQAAPPAAPVQGDVRELLLWARSIFCVNGWEGDEWVKRVDTLLAAPPPLTAEQMHDYEQAATMAASTAPASNHRPDRQWYESKIKETLNDNFAVGHAAPTTGESGAQKLDRLERVLAGYEDMPEDSTPPAAKSEAASQPGEMGAGVQCPRCDKPAAMLFEFEGTRHCGCLHTDGAAPELPFNDQLGRACAKGAAMAASAQQDERKCWATDGGYKCLNCGHALSQHEGQRYCPEAQQAAALQEISDFGQMQDRPAQQEAPEREYSQMHDEPAHQSLSNLLARIHRDGGHYEAQHGTQKAVNDANSIVANLYAAQQDEREAGSTYLCKAWGETDFPAAAIVTDMDGVRTFLIEQWLGSADETDNDGANLLGWAFEDMQMQWDLEGEAWEWKVQFEIGGVSVQKVSDFSPTQDRAARQVQAAPKQDEREAVVACPAKDADDYWVEQFAVEMKRKLDAARAKGRAGWQSCNPDELSRMLREHVDKGDPRDVANFCMFLWATDQPITGGGSLDGPTLREAFEAFAKERGLDLSRKPHHPNDYASTMTEVAWMGFQGGRKANVRLLTVTKTWEPKQKCNECLGTKRLRDLHTGKTIFCTACGTGKSDA